MSKFIYEMKHTKITTANDQPKIVVIQDININTTTAATDKARIVTSFMKQI